MSDSDDDIDDDDELDDETSDQEDNRPAIATPDIAPLNTATVANATGPRRVIVDGQIVEQHSLKDQIEADRYVNSKAAVKQPGRGWLSGILSRMIPPGSA